MTPLAGSLGRVAGIPQILRAAPYLGHKGTVIGRGQRLERSGGPVLSGMDAPDSQQKAFCPLLAG